jgi:ubiquinone/menaquinone biosynthesis C-methylase UbiE
MTDYAEKKVSDFYNTVGWETVGEITEDAKKFEDLRAYASEYVSNCRLRLLRHIPREGIYMLDMASGPIQYKEYLEYSRNYRKRYCVDLSLSALEKAKMKIGDHGVFLHGSFLDIPMEENFFDCTISLHTIYHIEKEKQEEAVRKLLLVTKPGKPVIIVYSNPDTQLVSFFFKLLRLPSRLLRLPHFIFRNLKSIFKKTEEKVQEEDADYLYFHAYSNDWWGRFSDKANVKILPWRSLDSNSQKRLIPDNKIGMKMFRILFRLEDRFPDFFVKHLHYPMIILTKLK